MPPIFYTDRDLRTPTPPTAAALAEGARRSGTLALVGFATKADAAAVAATMPAYVRAKPAVVLSHVAVVGDEPIDRRFPWEQRTPTCFATYGVVFVARRLSANGVTGPAGEQRLARFIMGLAEMGLVSQ